MRKRGFYLTFEFIGISARDTLLLGNYKLVKMGPTFVVVLFDDVPA